MTTFLACPFCGSLDIDTDGPCYTQPMCNGCGAQVYDQPSRDDAIAAWNRRAPPQPHADGVEAAARARALEEAARLVEDLHPAATLGAEADFVAEQIAKAIRALSPREHG